MFSRREILAGLVGTPVLGINIVPDNPNQLPVLKFLDSGQIDFKSKEYNFSRVLSEIPQIDSNCILESAVKVWVNQTDAIIALRIAQKGDQSEFWWGEMFLCKCRNNHNNPTFVQLLACKNTLRQKLNYGWVWENPYYMPKT